MYKPIYRNFPFLIS